MAVPRCEDSLDGRWPGVLTANLRDALCGADICLNRLVANISGAVHDACKDPA